MGGEKDFVGQEYEVAQAGADVQKKDKKSIIGRIAVTGLFGLTMSVAIAVVAFSIVFSLAIVEGPSMMKTINAGFVQNRDDMDHALVNRFREARRGDIIIVDAPRGSGSDTFIKRLIAIEGDRVRFEQRGNSSRDYSGWVGQFPADRYFVLMIMFAGANTWVELSEHYLDIDKGFDFSNTSSGHGSENNGGWGRMGAYGANFFEFVESGGNPNARPFWTTNFNPYGNFADFIVINDSVPNYVYIPAGYFFYMGDNRGSLFLPDFNGYHSYDSTEIGPQPISVFRGVVADIIPVHETFFAFILRMLVYYLTFQWLF